MPISSPEPVDPLVAQAESRLGQVLREKWRLERLLGVGGMAAVYAATHRNGAKAALKVLHRELGAHGEIKARFQREGYVANAVEHPGTVKVLDDDVTEDGSPYLVMELLEGETLDGRMRRLGGSLPASDALGMLDQLLSVLVAAHAKGVLHRDLKPENLFLTLDGTLKVLDFGIARLRESASADSATRTGTVMGTPAFMAPEQARGLHSEVDARTDLWAAGATTFALMVGRAPHDGRTSNEVLLSAMTQPVAPISSCVAGLGAHVAAFVDRSVSFARDARYADALAMQDALRVAWAADASGVEPAASIAPAAPVEAPREAGPLVALATAPTALHPASVAGHAPPQAKVGAGTQVTFGRTGGEGRPRRLRWIVGAALAGAALLGVGAWVAKGRSRPPIAPAPEVAAAAVAPTAPVPTVAPAAVEPTPTVAPAAVAVIEPAPSASAAPSLPVARVAPAARAQAVPAPTTAPDAPPPGKKPGGVSFSSRQ